MSGQDNIGNGIPGTYLVKSHTLHGLAVNARLDLSDRMKNTQGVLPGQRREIGVLEFGPDLTVVAVMMAAFPRGGDAEERARQRAVVMGLTVERYQPRKACIVNDTCLLYTSPSPRDRG